jgi:hypothetical protein
VRGDLSLHDEREARDQQHGEHDVPEAGIVQLTE